MGKVALPFLGMVMAEFAQAGLLLLSKALMSKGMSYLVFIFYSNTLAALVLLPFALLLHRSNHPPLNITTLCGFFLLGLLGYLAQILGYSGLNLSSATLCSAMLNLIPAFTFILAVAFRLERLDWRSSSSIAKLLGTVVSISGAFIVTLYKGVPLWITPSSSNLYHPQFVSQQSNWVLGGLLLAADCVMASTFNIVQVLVLKKHPAELILAFYYCFFVAIQSAVTCLVLERAPSAWSLTLNYRWIAVLYSGVFGSAFQIGVTTWCVHQTGPVFITIFKPIGIIISVVAGVIFLGDTFYLGSLIGATVIVVGFYSVVWGKVKEAANRPTSFEPRTEKTPLLKNSNGV